mgnify:CR=1 FL=1
MKRTQLRVVDPPVHGGSMPRLSRCSWPVNPSRVAAAIFARSAAVGIPAQCGLRRSPNGPKLSATSTLPAASTTLSGAAKVVQRQVAHRRRRAVASPRVALRLRPASGRSCASSWHRRSLSSRRDRLRRALSRSCCRSSRPVSSDCLPAHMRTRWSFRLPVQSRLGGCRCSRRLTAAPRLVMFPLAS